MRKPIDHHAPLGLPGFMPYFVILLGLISGNQLSSGYVATAMAQEKISGIPRVNRPKGRAPKVNYQMLLPVVGDVIFKRQNELRYKLLHPERDAEKIKPYIIEKLPDEKSLLNDEMPNWYTINRDTLLAFYLNRGMVYRVDIHFKKISPSQAAGFLRQFGIQKCEAGRSESGYCYAHHRSGAFQVDIIYQKIKHYVNGDKTKTPTRTTNGPAIASIQLSPIDWLKTQNRISAEMVASMRKGQVMLGMTIDEVKATLTGKYRGDWQEISPTKKQIKVYDLSRSMKGKYMYTIHMTGRIVSYLTK